MMKSSLGACFPAGALHDPLCDAGRNRAQAGIRART